MDGLTSEREVTVKKNLKKTTVRKKKKAAEGPVPCQYCGKEFQNRGKTLRHERHNCAVKPVKEAMENAIKSHQFHCKVCDQSFKYASGLSKHEQKHELPGGFFCKTCDAQFISDMDRVSHRETAHKMFKCQICSELFDSETGYIDHIELLHNGKEREYVVCTVCGAQFRTLAQLSSHKNTKCGTVKRFTCKMCGSKFMTQNTLNVHFTIHKGEKTHLCNYCGNSFLSKGQLKVHERSHTGEKPFKCEVCKKAFAYRESLVTHSSLHTGIKPYLCEGCGSRFSCIGNVIKHRRSRPDTCGSPRFKTNVKVAPRASAKNFVSLTKSRSKRNTRSTSPPPPDANPDIVVGQNETEYDESLRPDELGDQIDVDETDKNADDQHFDGILDDNNDIKLDAIISDLEAVPDGSQQHTYMSTTESMEIVSNVEIEYITSDNLHTTSLLIESMEPEPVETEEFSNPQYIINFVEELDKQQDGYDEQWQDDEVFEENDLTNSFESFKEEIIPAEVSVSESILPNERNELGYTDGSSAQTFQKTHQDIVPEEQFEESEDFNKEVQPSMSPQSESLELKPSIAATEEMPQTVESVIPPAIKILMYGCSICNQEFRFHTKYIVHLQKKHGIAVSQVIVDETGPAKPLMKTVQRTGGAGKKLSATGPISAIKSTAKAATLPETKEVVFCSTCDRSFGSAGALRKHNTVHGPDGSWVHKCGCCRLFFGTEALRQQHEIFMHKDKLHCMECDKMFKCPDSLVVHNRQTHIASPVATNTNSATTTTALKTSSQQRKYEYVCPRCGRKFSSKLALNDHERSKCGDSPVYKCNVCDKSYHSAGSLKTHSTVHTGELPHCCKFCGKAFRTQGQVKVHERKHNGEKPFQCEFCPKSFAYRESLLTHVSQHTGLKRFMCPACGCRFSCITNLQAHRKSHINTCGQVPLVTKPVGPMVLGAANSEAIADDVVIIDSIEITELEI